MKYLDNAVLTRLSAELSANPSPEARLNVRVEAYSIKPVAKERKMFKEMEEAYVSGQEEMEEMSFSPEMKEAGLSSCFGRLDVKESRKVHFLLVSTLNSAFPEYDFSALRPDHFTREISAAQVISHLSGNLPTINAVDFSLLSQSGPMSPTYHGSSPTSPSPFLSSSVPIGSSPIGNEVGNPGLYRILNDVVPLQDCEVYSWFPEPEYDPHVDPEENEEASEYEEDEGNEFIDADSSEEMDIDVEGPAVSWGQAGMDLELDDIPSAPSNKSINNHSASRSTKRSKTNDLYDHSMSSPHLHAVDDWNAVRRVGGLLWSANYFFYSKRQKRVLFISAWCRKRPSHDRSPNDQGDHDSLPLPISASFTPPSSGFQGFTALAAKANRPPRVSHHNLSNARPSHRKPKPAVTKLSASKSLTSSTIPIRGMSVPHSTPSRLAASAPSTLSPLASPSAAIARMTAGGFKPRQTAARLLINAAAASNRPSAPSSSIQRLGTGGEDVATESSRVRKERSGSLTPGPSRVTNFDLNKEDSSAVVDSTAKGKRVKV